MQPGRARTSGLGVPLLPLARWVDWVAPVRPTHGVLVLSCPSAALRVCSVLGCWAPVHRCARAVCCGASAVSWASWLLFTGVLDRCVVLHVRCPGPLGSCSPVCVLCAVRVCHGWLCPSSSPPNFRFFFTCTVSQSRCVPPPYGPQYRRVYPKTPDRHLQLRVPPVSAPPRLPRFLQDVRHTVHLTTLPSHPSTHTSPRRRCSRGLQAVPATPCNTLRGRRNAVTPRQLRAPPVYPGQPVPILP